MWKSKSRAFRKCGTFWVYDFLKGSYRLSKFSHFSIAEGGVAKKQHSVKNAFSDSAWIGGVSHRVDYKSYSFQVRTIIINGVLFLAVHRQLNRWPCHWVTHWVTETPFDFDIKEQSQRLVTFKTFDQGDQKTWPDPKRPTYLHTYPPTYLPTYLITHWATFGFLTFVDRNFLSTL